MRAPSGILEIVALYGDPGPWIRDDGTVSSIWESRMTKVLLPASLPLGWDKTVRASTVRVNQAIAVEVDLVLRSLHEANLWDHMKTFDGAYCWRSQRGSTKLSMHAFGGAMDFNAETNALGTKGDMDPGVVNCFEAHGWTWGGRWGRPDPMHFSFASGY